MGTLVAARSYESDALGVPFLESSFECRVCKFVAAKAHVHGFCLVVGNDLIGCSINIGRSQCTDEIKNDVCSRCQATNCFCVECSFIDVAVGCSSAANDLAVNCPGALNRKV